MERTIYLPESLIKDFFFLALFLSEEVLSVLEFALGFLESSVWVKDAEFVFTIDSALLFIWGSGEICLS